VIRLRCTLELHVTGLSGFCWSVPAVWNDLQPECGMTFTPELKDMIIRRFEDASLSQTPLRSLLKRRYTNWQFDDWLQKLIHNHGWF